MPANFDKKILQKNFARSAENYENFAVVQKQAAIKLCELATPFIQPSFNILDLGCGSGFIAQNLDKNLNLFEVDLALEMLQKNHHRNSLKIQADFENLPFVNHSFDILISSFSLQWLHDFEKNFANFFDLIKPDGKFIFCLPTAESLSELRAADVFELNQLPKISALKSALKKVGFKEIFCHNEIITENFDSGVSALKSLKQIGAGHNTKTPQIINQTKLEQFNNFCLKNCSSANRKITISWTISYFIFSK